MHVDYFTGVEDGPMIGRLYGKRFLLTDAPALPEPHAWHWDPSHRLYRNTANNAIIVVMFAFCLRRKDIVPYGIYHPWGV